MGKGKKEVFSGMTSGVSVMGLYYNAAAKEFGEEKALQLFEKVGESMGAGTAKGMKEKLGNKTPTMKELKETLDSSYKSMGFTNSSKAGKTKLTNKVMSCPFYDGLAMAGLSHETINKICTHTSAGEYRSMMMEYPQLEAAAEPKKTSDGVCIESYKLRKR